MSWEIGSSGEVGTGTGARSGLYLVRAEHRQRLILGPLVLFQVQAPAHALPTDEQFYMDGDRTKPDIAFLKNHFYREGRLTEEQALFILRKCVAAWFKRDYEEEGRLLTAGCRRVLIRGSEILHEEPNLLEVDAPITGRSSSTTVLAKPSELS